jgi:lipoprotein-anchoring transpeptidase ErfK/SrfK
MRLVDFITNSFVRITMNLVQNIFSSAVVIGTTITTIAFANPTSAAQTGTYVKVDLTTQSATLYKNGTADKTFQILTGKDSTPTPTGTFKINNNRQYTPGGNKITLTGSYGTAKVGIWNPFIGNSIAFHNAPWRQEYEFGNTKRRKKNGSHGCINMRFGDALYLYKNTKSGTPVYVSK